MPERPMPPVMADVRRPHLSASKKAGTEIASISIADTPDARNDAVFEESPACENKRGAYCDVVSNFRVYDGWLSTHVKHTVDSGELDHTQHEKRQHGPGPVSPSKQDCYTLPKCQAYSLLGGGASAQEGPFGLRHREVKPAQCIQSSWLVTTAHRPSWRFGKLGAESDQDHRHENHDDERQPPRHAGLVYVDTPIASEVADADTSCRHELRQAGQYTPALRGRYF